MRDLRHLTRDLDHASHDPAYRAQLLRDIYAELERHDPHVIRELVIAEMDDDAFYRFMTSP